MKYCAKTVGVVTVLVFQVLASRHSEEPDSGGGGVREVWAAPGTKTELPCDLRSSSGHDGVGMVLWFKDDMRMPFYTVDFRNGPPEHWAVTGDLGGRSHFVLDEESPSKAHLTIAKVTYTDEGLFRCRIDFVDSPTKNYKVNLTVIVPPEEPRIYDAEGREIIGNLAGPFREGHDLLLSCQVTGGKPAPNITWWHGEERIATLADAKSVGGTVSQVYLPSVTRDLNGAKLQCRSSMLLLPTQVKDITLKVYLKPQYVRLSGSKTVRAGQQATFSCTTKGSKPHPNVDWFLNSKSIDSSESQTQTEGNLTKSVLTLTPKREDGGRALVCRVSNPWFPAHTIEDTVVLNVLYSPLVKLTLVSPNVENLREDEDAELLCEVDSNPLPSNFSFYKDSRELHEDPIGGIVLSGNRLIIKNLRRHHSAIYKCKATNNEGTGQSEPLHFTVLYRPECTSGTAVQQLAGAIGGQVRARCSVDAPPVRSAGPLRFYWTYNSTRDVLPIPASNVTVHGSSSAVVHGIPAEAALFQADSELGWLACWASNDVGNQREPCLYRIVPAALPEPPSNCEVSEDETELRCEPGHDGGLPQRFVLEVLELRPSVVQPQNLLENEISTMNDQGFTGRGLTEAVYRASNDAPQFSLDPLSPGRYTLLVYAETPRGRSPRPAALHSVSIRALADVDRPDSLQTMTPPPPASDNGAALVVGAALSLVLLTLLTTLCVALVVLCKKKRKPKQEVEHRSVGVSMYSGSIIPSQGTLVPTVLVRGSRGSRVLSARWSSVLDDAPLAVLALDQGPHQDLDHSESGGSEEDCEQQHLREAELDIHQCPRSEEKYK